MIHTMGSDQSAFTLLLQIFLLGELAALQPLLNKQSISFALFQSLQVRNDVLFKLVGTFVVVSFWLVVEPTISEYFYDILTKVLSISVFVVIQLLLDCFHVDRLPHYQIVVRNILDRYWLPERPTILLFSQQIDNILTFQQKRDLFGFDKLLMLLPSPSTLLDSWDVHGIDFEVFGFILSILSNIGLSHHLL